jgi:hypothetical protein
MNSFTLKEKGFADFISLKELQFASLPADQNCVIVLIECLAPEKPATDILYIGKSKKPAKRIFGGYIAGYGGKTTRKIHSKLLNEGYMEKISVSWMISDNIKITQKELLESFKKEHGQYPAWNTQKKPVVKPAKVPKIVKVTPRRKVTKNKP